MQIPSLPTDNLYKFLAIAGLVIIVLSVVGPWSRYEQLTPKTIEVETQVSTHKREIVSVESAIMRTEEELKKAKTQKERELLLARAEELQKQKRQLQIMISEIAGKRTLLQHLQERVALYFVVGTYSLVFGVIVSIVGFVLWYRRVQRYQDGILKQQHKALTGNSTKPVVGGEDGQKVKTESPNKTNGSYEAN